MSEEIKALKKELAATKLLLRQEMLRSEEAIELAKYSLESLHIANNKLRIATHKGKMKLKA
jgi:DNA-directed RNA polymerase subunit L